LVNVNDVTHHQISNRNALNCSKRPSVNGNILIIYLVLEL
jgi:hypothetical protein